MQQKCPNRPEVRKTATVRCHHCDGATYTYSHHRERTGNSRRFPLPCPVCQNGAYRITEWIDAVPGRCGGRPCLKNSRFDVVHIIGYLTRCGYTPESMAAEWNHRPVEAFRHVLKVHESGRFPMEFWEEEYDPVAWGRRLPELAKDL